MAFKSFTNSNKQLRGDARFNNRVASKFINCMMWDGKKSVSQRVFYEAMDRIAEKITEVPPVEVFQKALENVKPDVEVRSKRVGGANYQVPMQVNPKRRQSLAIRWILSATRGKKGRPMAHKLADELMAAYKREGDAMQQREMVHRMAEANKAFAHFGYGR
jgi:small subunit ribosomal protein S7